MKANELMVGDWVQNPLGAKGWVKEIRLLPKDPDGFGGYYLVDIAYSKDGDSYARLEAKELSPIPLTPEILKKNGFVIESRCCHDSLQYCELVDGLWIDITGENCFEGKLEYIHQLQHALRICGIEKEIEL